jgi:peptide/nickel transport system permease protein
MIGFVLRRLAGAVMVLFVLSVVTFLLFAWVPGGDPAVRMAGRTATEQNVANIRHAWGFDRSLPVQYASLMKRTFVTGDLVSYANQTNVRAQILRGLPVTLSLALGAAVLWSVLGVLLGTLSALYASRWPDRLLTFVAVTCIALPSFWVGLELRHLLGEQAGIFPTGGYVGLGHSVSGWFSHLLLPWFVLALLFVGVYARVVRAAVLDVLEQDYVRTARAKGVPERKVLTRHVLRSSLTAVVTLFGLDFAGVLAGGTILVEAIFDLHGVGQYAADAVSNLDLPPLIGVALYGGFTVVVLSALVDIAYGWLDPRVHVK